mgnify:FL=1
MRMCVAWMGLLWALFGALPASAQNAEDLAEWRAWYREASTGETATTMVERMVSDCGTCEEHPLSHGFLAVSNLMVADELLNPLEKLKIFNAWQPVLESAVAALPEHPDLALLRLGVQTHVPSILNYSSNTQADRMLVERALAEGHWSSDRIHAAFVRDFLTYLKSL